MKKRLSQWLAGSVLSLMASTSMLVTVIAAGLNPTPAHAEYTQTYYGPICRNLATSSLNPYMVLVFQHANFNQGQDGYCALVSVGLYPHSYSISTSMPNDSISSIMVGSAVTAFLYSDANYGGREEMFWYNDASLSNNFIGNDSVSSMCVRYR